MTDRCYVYAIVPQGAPIPPRLGGFGGPLTTVPCRALAAAISVVGAAEVRPAPENLLRHEAIVEALRRHGPALPVRFGTVLPSLDAVVRALAERYALLVADMDRLTDKIEFDVAVLWDPTHAVAAQRLDAEAPDLAAVALGPGTRYLRARLAAQRREDVLRSRAVALARALDAELLGAALESRHHVLPTPRLALTAAYLLPRARAGAFREAFASARRAHAGEHLLLSGPWPPYSFVTAATEACPPPPRTGANGGQAADVATGRPYGG